MKMSNYNIHKIIVTLHVCRFLIQSFSFSDYDQRWKMLHYSALDFFSPIILVPELEISNNLTIYLVSDVLVDLEVVFSVEVYNWDRFLPLTTYISDTILLVSSYNYK